MKRSFADILGDVAALQRKKVEAKLPGWADVDGLEFPDALCLEQCSGTAAAIHKASFIPEGCRIADLTGGLGVDSWAFSRRASAVLYFERNAVLQEAAARNFIRLGADGIVTVNAEVSPEGGPWLQALREFKPDWIYADPARRDGLGKKVFLLEDCRPDIAALLPLLYENAGNILLKLSPMADISMLASRFSGHLRELHVVGLGGEVKELLCLLSAQEREGWTVSVEDAAGGTQAFSFSPGEEAAAEAVFHGPDGLEGLLLHEPTAPMMKAGAFKLPCSRFGMEKLGSSTHLYVAPSAIPEARGLFKLFRIMEVVPLNKASLKEIGKKYPRAEVSAKGIPKSSEELRTRTGCRTGSDIHVFGCGIAGGKYLIAAARQ